MSLDFLLKTFSEEKPQKKATGGRQKGEDPSLKGLLQRERLKWKKKQKPFEASQYFSPSNITYNLCARAKVAQLAGLHKIYYEVPAPKLKLTFDVGHAYHKIIQDYFWEAGILEGEYRCIKCDKGWWDTSPTQCIHRKSHTKRHLKYKEVPFKIPELLISGRADGIIHFDVNHQIEKHLIDIKTIANRGSFVNERQHAFEDLKEKGAKHDHIVQLNFYMYALNIHKGHLLYVSKNTSQTESFYFQYDPAIIEPYLEQIRSIIQWAEDIKSKKRKDLPPTCAKGSCNCEDIIL